MRLPLKYCEHFPLTLLFYYTNEALSNDCAKMQRKKSHNSHMLQRSELNLESSSLTAHKDKHLNINRKRMVCQLPLRRKLVPRTSSIPEDISEYSTKHTRAVCHKTPLQQATLRHCPPISDYGKGWFSLITWWLTLFVYWLYHSLARIIVMLHPKFEVILSTKLCLV